MSQVETTAEVLNDLVKINNDRIEGYNRAINELHDLDIDLKAEFRHFIEDSEKYKQELSSLISSLGGDVATGTTMSGKIYRAWMDVKATFTGGDRKAVIAACEFGEDAAQKAYKTALEMSGELTPEAVNLINEQQQALKKAHDMVKAQRDSHKSI